jgi:DNA-binding winged helix-turn-helix (wHTH) protein
MIPAVPQPAARLRFGTVTFVPAERLLLRDGQPVALTPKAFDLLAFLVAHPGRLLTKDELLQAVWPDAIVEESNLAYHVFAIRKALGDTADADQYIETVPKSGYRFIAPVAQLDEASESAAHAHIAPAAASADQTPAANARHAETADVRAAIASRDSRPSRWRDWAVGAACLTAGVIGANAIHESRSDATAPPARLSRFREPLWGPLAEGGTFSVSPDGRHLMMAIQGADGAGRLWVRALDEPAPHAVPGSEAFLVPPAMWSPAGDEIVFGNTPLLKRVTLPQGTPQDICRIQAIAVGGSWHRNDVLVIGNPAGPILRCSASAGGTATPITRPSRPSEIHLMPSFLPDGRHFLYLRVDRAAPERSGVYIGDANGGAPESEKHLLATGFDATYVPAADSGFGVVVFLRDRALFAQRFDDRRQELLGDPVRLATNVGSFIDYAFFSASPRVLVYRAPDPDYQLTWFDRTGREVRRVGTPQPVDGLALSPSGDRALIVKHTPQNVADQDLWLFDVANGVNANPRRQTFAPTLEAWPVWLSDDRFAYGATGADQTVYAQVIDGSRETWFDADTDGRVSIAVRGGGVSIAADNGGVAVFSKVGDPSTRLDIWARTEHGPSTGAPLVTREGDQAYAQLSPDGRWLAYVSNESGRNEVFLTPLRYDAATGTVSAGESVPVSDGGGFTPRWRGDSRELLYLKLDGSVMAVDIDPHTGAALGTTKRLFTAPGVFPEWGVTRDGSRLLFAVPTAPMPPLDILYDWQSLLPS